MNKTMTIAAREFDAAVRTKAFVISLVSMPLFMLGSLIVQAALRDTEDRSDQKYAIVDRSPGGEIAQAIVLASQARDKTIKTDPKTGKPEQSKYVVAVVSPSASDEDSVRKQRLELSDRVRAKEFLGFVEIGPDVVRPKSALPSLDGRGRPVGETDEQSSIRYQSDTPMKSDFAEWCRTVVNGYAMVKRAGSAGVPVQAITDALRPVPLSVTRLTKVEAASGKITDTKQENRLVNFLLPMMLSVLMFMMILVGTTPLMNSVLEEKVGRVAEVLLGSVTPFELMMGKLIGMIGVSLVGMTLYLVGAYYAAVRFGVSEHVTPAILVWFVAFQVLGVLMYGSLFIAIGAASTDAKEAQSLITPVMLLATIPFFVMTKVIEDPNGGLATAMSFFPFATPSIMMMRLVVPPGVAWWQPWAGMGVVILASIVCVWAGGRVFRVGLLMQGKGANFGQMLKWVIKG